MNHTLSRMQVGEVFRITDREGKTRHAFFAGKYKTPDHQDWTYYNFLYWVASPRSASETFIRSIEDIPWQTSDFFRYREDIIQSLASVKKESLGIFHFPLVRQSPGGLSAALSAQKHWFALASYQIVIADTSTQEDIDALFEIIKFEEDLPVDNLQRPLLPKRKEQHTNESYTERSEDRRRLSYH